MQLEDRLIKSIKVEDRARKDYGDLSELIQSIREKGLIQPITITDAGRLLSGGRRLEAASQAGLEVIACVIRQTADNIDALEIELFENIHRKDFLWAERARLEQRIFDLKTSKDPNWSQNKQAVLTDVSKGLVNRRLQLAEALQAAPELADFKTEDEAWKALKKIEEKIVVDALVNRAKSVALKGVKIADRNYRVGDVFKGIATLKDEIYDFAEVDPPYAIELQKRKSRNLNGGTEQYNEWSDQEYSKKILHLAQEVYRVTKQHSWTVWWYGMSWHTETLAILREIGFVTSDIPAIWVKGGPGQTASPDTSLGSSYEPFFVCRKGDAKLAKAGRGNVFDYRALPPSEKIHPTEKPLELVREIICTFSFPGARCVVPLLGSGVTIRAAMCEGRIAFGWDLSNENKQRFLARVAQDESSGLFQPTI